MMSAVGGRRVSPKSRRKKQNQLIFDSDGEEKKENFADVIHGSPQRKNEGHLTPSRSALLQSSRPPQSSPTRRRLFPQMMISLSHDSQRFTIQTISQR